MAGRKAPPVRRDDRDMKGPRSRNETGRLRQKRGDTRVDTIEEQYGVDLGVRGDMQLDTLRERHGGKSLNDIIKEAKG